MIPQHHQAPSAGLLSVVAGAIVPDLKGRAGLDVPMSDVHVNFYRNRS